MISPDQDHVPALLKDAMPSSWLGGLKGDLRSGEFLKCEWIVVTQVHVLTVSDSMSHTCRVLVVIFRPHRLISFIHMDALSCCNGAVKEPREEAIRLPKLTPDRDQGALFDSSQGRAIRINSSMSGW